MLPSNSIVHQLFVFEDLIKKKKAIKTSGEEVIKSAAARCLCSGQWADSRGCPARLEESTAALACTHTLVSPGTWQCSEI